MAEKKLNRRVQYTRNALREALIDLICEKPLSNISITDICARADINRSTFYLHYRGVHELLSEIEEKIILQTEAQLSSPPSIQTLHTLTGFLEHLQQSPRDVKLFAALTGEQGDPHFVHRLQTLIYDAFQRGWQNRMPEATESYKRLVFSYTVSGIISVLSGWMVGEMPDLNAGQVVGLLEAITDRGMRGISGQIHPT